MKMKKFVVTCLGCMLAIVAASPDCGAQVLAKFDGGGGLVPVSLTGPIGIPTVCLVPISSTDTRLTTASP